ncbi:DgyrCDS1145 [Dimorphilus gyrociliatus]|uniref:DgyrCDS1145 n=1 Tax=Dimorphilus gyrociliatus TaxID=2664684 RepID=A0A7I8V877_9ANNE|nr:DgyrCDS1145 [Dimorphilus gyrociliatus]
MSLVEGKHRITLTIKDKDNSSFKGLLFITNSSENSTPLPTPYDQIGASSYVIAVVLVYGLSIVMLIASHIKRRHDKAMEDRQIEKYIQAVPNLKEKSARDTYRNLKRSIVPIVAVALASSPTLPKGTRNKFANLTFTPLPKFVIHPPESEHRGSLDSGKCSPSISLSTKSLLHENEECIDVTTVV